MPIVSRSPKQKRLIEAFEQALTQHPLEHITITDLVELADTSRGTFYYHYKTIDQLLHDYLYDKSLAILLDITHHAPFATHEAFFTQVLLTVTAYRDFFNLIHRQHLEDQLLDIFTDEICPLVPKDERYDYACYRGMVVGYLSPILDYANHAESSDIHEFVKRLTELSEKTIDNDRILVGSDVRAFPQVFTRLINH